MKKIRVILAALAILATILACRKGTEEELRQLAAIVYIVPANTDTAYTAFTPPTQTTTPAPTQTPQVWRARICEEKCTP